MSDPRDPEVSVETTEGDRPRSSAGDRLMIGLAVLALAGGGLIGVSKLLPSEATTDASATPHPSQNRGATPAPSEGGAALRTYTVTYSPPRDDVVPPRDDVVPPQSATGWIRARRQLAIRSDPRNDATVSRRLRPGDAAFVVDDRPVDPTGWVEVVAPVNGWLPRSSVVGRDVERFSEHPLDQASAHADQIVAGGDGQFLMGIWDADGYGYGLGVMSGGNAWHRTDPPRGTAFVRAAFGPLGWIAFAVSGQANGPHVWLWQSNDGLGWSSLGDASGLFSANQLAPIAVVGSPLGYVMTSSFDDEAGAHHVWFSADGLTWSERSVPLAAPALATTDIGFYAYTTNLSQRRVAAFSPNGEDWSEVDTTNLGQLVGVAGARDHFVALERVGSITYSWTARGEGGELVWRRGSGSEPAFGDAVVTALSGDQVPIAVGWERSTEAALWWSYDDAGWHRHRLPSSFAGLPWVAASSRAGFVVVGSGGGALGRDPVVWASGPNGDLQKEGKPFLATDGTFDPEVCAAYSGDLLDMLANQGIGYAECRGSEPFTVRGYVLPCEGCEEDGARPPIADARWLADPAEERMLRLSPVVTDDMQWLEAVLAPGVAPNARWSRHWVVVTGHYDDPAADSCRLPPAAADEPFYQGRAEVVARCRSRFVVTEVRIER
jgi:hypothetical protein